MSDKVTLPNFLIAGPTKSGTTSLSIYLNQHPDIYIPRLKEPHFFSARVANLPLSGPGSGKVEASYIKEFDDYTKLYEGVHEKARGDATADTIFYGEKIIPEIRRYLGDPKIIILLRDPVKRAFSAYQHLVRDKRESLSFERALEEEGRRIQERYDPLFYYRECSLYADRVRVFRESFSDVLVLFTKDLYEAPDEMFEKIFRFLEVDPDFKIDASQRHNISGKPRNQALNDFVSKENPLRSVLRPLIRMFTSERLRKKIVYSIQKKNLQRMQISPATEKALREYFKSDIQRLEKYLGMDLSKWYH